MDAQFNHTLFERRPFMKSKTPAVKWFKEWVPQDVVATGGKCSVLRWVTESQLNALKEKAKEPPAVEPEPEPKTEVLFLCSYEGCGKIFTDAGALRKHSHIHGERQYVCHYEGCGKKFLDSSKLKRHFLIHTGERDYICPHEGCGKNSTVELVKYATPPEKVTKPSKPPSGAYGSASSDRPHACPYEGCEKAYIHEYKLKLHLRREHPGHMAEENAETATPNAENEMDEGSDHDAYNGKRANGKSKKQSRPKPNLKMPPAKITQRKSSSPSPATLNVVKKSWPVKEETYEEEDSEETEEEDRDNAEDGWRYGGNDDDDEETEYED
ncbi:hypothetical protein Tsubulata_001038 [Turnera subulata]|uniref:C2H2-type domain-containing protein n=1 Tax=Turnera subulata TaxID=218843 RepID=A0A9Q0FLQ6_9ROSI|nr:hypothetical protein Tsubulata_001038 [Turnera subulata]